MDSPITLFGPAKPLFAGEQRYVRVKRALSLIGLGRTTLYSLVQQGKIRAIKLGHMTYIDLDSVAALFAQCPQLVPEKHIEGRMLTAAQIGLPEPDDLNIAAPPDPDALPALTVSAADLDGLAIPPSAAKDDGG